MDKLLELPTKPSIINEISYKDITAFSTTYRLNFSKKKTITCYKFTIEPNPVKISNKNLLIIMENTLIQKIGYFIVKNNFIYSTKKSLNKKTVFEVKYLNFDYKISLEIENLFKFGDQKSKTAVKNTKDSFLKLFFYELLDKCNFSHCGNFFFKSQNLLKKRNFGYFEGFSSKFHFGSSYLSFTVYII